MSGSYHPHIIILLQIMHIWPDFDKINYKISLHTLLYKLFSLFKTFIVFNLHLLKFQPHLNLGPSIFCVKYPPHRTLVPQTNWWNKILWPEVNVKYSDTYMPGCTILVSMYLLAADLFNLRWLITPSVGLPYTICMSYDCL